MNVEIITFNQHLSETFVNPHREIKVPQHKGKSQNSRTENPQHKTTTI